MDDNLERVDVAFSFLASDEAIAERLAAEVRERLRPFLYSEAQKEVAGKDGVAVFTRLYGETASLAVVLYRAGYGQSKWTRVEESAITSRGVDRGWNGVLVISLDGAKPPWIPASRLWFGLEQFGIESASEVIIARHAETGTEPRPETALDRALHIAAKTEKADKAERAANSPEGVALARDAVNELWRYLEEQATLLQRGAPSLAARASEPSHDVRYFTINGARVSFGWAVQYSNTLDGSNLLVRELSWPRSRSTFVDPHWDVTCEELWIPKVHPETSDLVWQRHRVEGPLLSSQELAEHYLKRLLDRHGGHEI